MLTSIACRVLGDKQRACIAVQNCWRTAFRNPPHFEYEGAFRSWVLRALIDEALEILRASQEEKEAASAAQTDTSFEASNQFEVGCELSWREQCMSRF